MATEEKAEEITMTQKESSATNAEMLTLMAFGGMTSLVLLRIAMSLWDNHYVMSETVDSTIVLWVAVYAILATIALLQKRRS